MTFLHGDIELLLHSVRTTYGCIFTCYRPKFALLLRMLKSFAKALAVFRRSLEEPMSIVSFYITLLEAAVVRDLISFGDVSLYISEMPAVMSVALLSPQRV